MHKIDKYLLWNYEQFRKKEEGELIPQPGNLGWHPAHTHLRVFLLLVPMLSKPTCYTHRNHFLDAKPGSTTSC